jgi:hypothetical protein
MAKKKPININREYQRTANSPMLKAIGEVVSFQILSGGIGSNRKFID